MAGWMRMVELSLLGGAALLVSAAFLWPSVTQHRSASDSAAAHRALETIAVRERAYYAAHQRFLAFGASPAERQAAFPDLTLEPGAESFAIDGFVDHSGALRLRAVSTPAAMQDGKVAPVLLGLELPAQSNGAPRP